MNNRIIRTIGRVTSLTAVLFCLVSFAGSVTTPANDPAITWNPKTIVDFDVAVTAVRQLPHENPFPGFHLDAIVNGRKTDIYIAPIEFVAEAQMTFSVGDDAHIVGSLTRLGATDFILARQVTIGRNTLYLRNDDGEPLWAPILTSM